MKRILLTVATALLAGPVFADIQDPPMNDNGPTRKLGRALSNLLFGLAEIPSSIDRENDLNGNNSAFTYGVMKGVGRTLFRFRAGVHELFTFPFPTERSSFRPPYKSNIPWINGGYEEFPPELGFQTRKQYGTTTTNY